MQRRLKIPFTVYVLLAICVCMLVFAGNAYVSRFSTASPAVSASTVGERPLGERTIAQDQTSDQTTPATPKESAGARAISGQSARTRSANAQLACVGSVFQKPTALPTADLPAGVTIQKDQPQLYEIFGNSIAELRASLRACQPRQVSAGEFHALTGYNLTWQYSQRTNSDGTCSLTDVKVASHVNQYLPFAKSTDPTWQAYSKAIRTHEDGHVDINLRRVRDLQAKLAVIQNLDCAAITTLAETTIQAQMTLLESENELYDATTNHGATQGAVL